MKEIEQNLSEVEVYLNSQKVGNLALFDRFRIAFQYDNDFIKNGFSICPTNLPLTKQVFIAEYEPFKGFFGVFNDSLPDGWGQLLLDRFLRKQGIDFSSINPLSRLSFLNSSSKGALEYKPSNSFSGYNSFLDLDKLNAFCQTILDFSFTNETLDSLFKMGGSSGGARPKINVKINNEEWIIKFPSSFDNLEIGEEEYDYSLCARECGIEISETKLFESRNCAGYFGTKRFDRKNGKRIHMVSSSGLLQVSHTVPSLDYLSLLKLTQFLTKSEPESFQLFKRACFNVFAHNRDDHSNNFSFLCEGGTWRLSPAYDLTYSNSIGGQHATTVNGNGINPSKNDLLMLSYKIGIKKSKAIGAIEEIETIVHQRLEKYFK